MKKHIILIQSDQHNANVLGCYGDKYVRTPNLDKMAEQGVQFNNCYCPSPLCVPSRISMMSGVLPSRTGVWTNEQSLHSDTPTFAHSLAIAGYETTLVGRMHFVGPDQRHGFMNRLVGDVCPTQLGVAGVDTYGVLGNTSGATRVAVEKSGSGNSKVLEYDRAVEHGACEYFESINEESKSQFITIGFYGPHCPFVGRKDLYEYYYNILPEPDEGPWDLHPYTKEFIERCGLENFKTEDLKRVKAAYYAMVEELDEHIGVLLNKIEETLGLENTLVIYTSDHGEMMGEKGLICKTHFYDSSAKVPFIVQGRKVEGRKVESPTSLLDLAPTLIEYANAPKLSRTDGENILPLIENSEKSTSDRIVISQFATTVDGYVSGMARKGDWKYVYYHGYDYPQLFNLKDDPKELNDLGKNAEYADLIFELKTELDKFWEPDKIKEDAIRSWGESRLIHKFNKAAGIKDPEAWECKSEVNYLD